MENKILVNLIVPVLEESYNVFIPVGKTVEDTLELLIECINRISHVSFKAENVDLYGPNGLVLDRNSYIKNSGLSNGCKALLI